MNKPIESIPQSRARRSTSKRAQIREYILSLIDTEEYQSGRLLPTLRQIAQEFNTSVTPVIQAMREFEREGIIEMVQGQGCRVRNFVRKDGEIIARPIVDVIGISEPLDARTRRHTIAGLQLGILQTLGTTSDLKSTVIAIPHNDANALDGALRDIIQQRPDGLTVGPVGEISDPQISRLQQIRIAGTHVVLFAASHEVATFDAIVSDFRLGQRLLTEHLLKKGHRELLRFRFSDRTYYEKLKQKGFADALQDGGFPEGTDLKWTLELVDPPANQVLDLNAKRLEQTTGALAIAFSQRPITAIMAANDHRAAEVMAALEILGKTGIEVTGYDGFWNELHGQISADYGADIANRQSPVSVDTQLVQCGSHMATLLIERVRGTLTDPQPQRITVPQSLILP